MALVKWGFTYCNTPSKSVITTEAGLCSIATDKIRSCCSIISRFAISRRKRTVQATKNSIINKMPSAYGSTVLMLTSLVTVRLTQRSLICSRSRTGIVAMTFFIILSSSGCFLMTATLCELE